MILAIAEKGSIFSCIRETLFRATALPTEDVYKRQDRRFTWEKAAPRKVGKIVNLLRDELQVFICGFLMNPYQNRIRRPLFFIRAVLIASDLKKTGVFVQNEIISPVAEQHLSLIHI